MFLNLLQQQNVAVVDGRVVRYLPLLARDLPLKMLQYNFLFI